MSDDSYKSIRNGVIASVLAGIILLAIPVLRGYFFGFLSWIWSGVEWLWHALLASCSLSGWALCVFFILALVGIIYIYKDVKRESEEPDFKSYTEEFIYGAKWKWNWAGNQFSNVWCFCPRCDGELVYDDSSCRSLYSDTIKTDFICENCGHSLITSISGGNKDYATGAVKREIDRRIRTGEYKKN